MIRSLLSLCALLSCVAALPAQAPQRDALERNIDRALAFLKTMQEKDGSWQLSGENNPTATALAVMAFLSAGHVPGEGPYGEIVEKGIGYVVRSQQPNGLLGVPGVHEMYQHGICTLMVAEAAGMTRGKLAIELRKKLEKAVALILQAQRTGNDAHRGGWRYYVNSPDADMSVSGWQVLALRAAKNLGCDVPSERIEMAVDYVQRCRDPQTGGFCYTPGGGATIPCTGTGILALAVCGKGRHSREALQAGSYLIKHRLSWDDSYFFYAVYYSSQATFQLGQNYWNFYRPQLHKVLFANQQPNGSWVGGEGFGPVYSTAMSILALTVEYRFLPIYQRGEEPEAAK